MKYLLIVPIIALSSLFSCSENGDKQLNTPDADPEKDDKQLDTPDAGATDSLARTLVHDGMTREYILYVPDSYDGTSEVPLMLNFHGYGGVARPVPGIRRYAVPRRYGESLSWFTLRGPCWMEIRTGTPAWNRMKTKAAWTTSDLSKR